MTQGEEKFTRLSNKELRLMTQKERDKYFKEYELHEARELRKRIAKQKERSAVSHTELRKSEDRCKYFIAGHLISRHKEEALKMIEELAEAGEYKEKEIAAFVRMYKTLSAELGNPSAEVPLFKVKELARKKTVDGN